MTASLASSCSRAALRFSSGMVVYWARIVRISSPVRVSFSSSSSVILSIASLLVCAGFFGLYVHVVLG